MENVKKHTDIKLVITEERRNNLASEPDYHKTNCFSENVLAIEMKRTRIFIINMSILIYQYWKSVRQ